MPDERSEGSRDGGGPYIQVAALCEKVLTERDGVLTLIRLVDRINVATWGPGAPTEMQPLGVKLKLVLSFKAGAARGSQDVGLRMVGPDGREIGTAHHTTIHFEAEDQGHAIIVDLDFLAEQVGVYWFCVTLRERTVTKIPLRILYQRSGPAAG